MSAVFGPGRLVLDAEELARELLADLPERWRHTRGVARVAGSMSGEDDAATLVAAAWLHDVGYAASVRGTGFHPLDGALHLRRLGWPERVVCLVAHHSEAWCVAEVRGLGEQLAAFPREQGAVPDALTYADQVVGPDGVVMDFEQRVTDRLRRHGPDSPIAAAHSRRLPLLRAAVQRATERAETRPQQARPLALP